MVESGGFYNTFIDPVLVPMRKIVASYIRPGEKVIDLACGTGAQVFEIAGVAKKAVGIDLSQSMIKKAGKIKLVTKSNNTEFFVGDIVELEMFGDNEFDVATMSLALHQFDSQIYKDVFSEMIRISGRIIITDYSVPLQAGFKGYATKFVEFLAGREHYRNFREYCCLGGLEAILKNYSLKTISQRKMAFGIFQVLECYPDETNASK